MSFVFCQLSSHARPFNHNFASINIQHQQFSTCGVIIVVSVVILHVILIFAVHLKVLVGMQNGGQLMLNFEKYTWAGFT